MRKASELIALAKNHHSYLAEGGNPYLCYVLYELQSLREMTWEELTLAKNEIRDAIGGRAFLRTYLRCNGVIDHLDDERSPEYSQVAHAFWDALIVKLQVAGN